MQKENQHKPGKRDRCHQAGRQVAALGVTKLMMEPELAALRRNLHWVSPAQTRKPRIARLVSAASELGRWMCYPDLSNWDSGQASQKRLNGTPWLIYGRAL